ncbi:hypothetical protein FKM82_000048 [Ascaphus truei]
MLPDRPPFSNNSPAPQSPPHNLNTIRRATSVGLTEQEGEGSIVDVGNRPQICSLKPNTSVLSNSCVGIYTAVAYPLHWLLWQRRGYP